MATFLTKSDLLDVMETARSYAVEAVIENDYPDSNAVECLAVLTETLRKAGRVLPSDIGRRVIMDGDGAEGVITGHINGYTVFFDGEEHFKLYDNTDQPITTDDFTFAEDVE